MSVIHDNPEPGVIDTDLLKNLVMQQAPDGEAGKVFLRDGVVLEKVRTIRLEDLNILRIDNLWMMTSLVKLQLTLNIIQKIENLDALVNLKELDLSFNQIEVLENLEKLTKLEILTVYENNIKKVENMDQLINLKLFSIGRNRIDGRDSVVYLRRFPLLRSLTMEGNPCSQEDDFTEYIYACLPMLMYYHYRFIYPHEKEAAKKKYSNVLKELEDTEAETAAYIKQREEEERKLKSYTAAFVEYLDSDQLFSALFENDGDGQALLKMDDEVVEVCKEYPFSFVIVINRSDFYRLYCSYMCTKRKISSFKNAAACSLILLNFRQRERERAKSKGKTRSTQMHNIYLQSHSQDHLLTHSKKRNIARNITRTKQQESLKFFVICTDMKLLVTSRLQIAALTRFDSLVICPAYSCQFCVFVIVLLSLKNSICNTTMMNCFWQIDVATIKLRIQPMECSTENVITLYSVLLHKHINVKEKVTQIHDEFCVITQKLFDLGLKQYKIREAEIEQFSKCVEDAKDKNAKQLERIRDTFTEKKALIYINMKAAIRGIENCECDTKVYYAQAQKCTEEFNSICHSAFTDLMASELTLNNQLEKVNKTFENNLNQLVEVFIRDAQALFSECCNIQKIFSERLAEYANCYLTNAIVRADDPTFSLPLELKSIMIDKERLNKASKNSHAYHIHIINEREDTLVERAKQWARNMCREIHREEIRRNRSKINEFNHFFEIQRQEFEELAYQAFKQEETTESHESHCQD
ncbi:dynein regulatory complex subunit 3-like [Schistocerca gregaria]|uniref:dynein regulatory complex subunit 3-like n=1 Tax=Schistocerca gregaria TaxID=7010 RepID=UPI00211ECCEB|nr:dynein regulatory complex subunit 3-like [Schistocerca gregaria]